MKKIALITLGCGHKDGSEITETVSSIIALSEFKTEIHFFSFDEDFPLWGANPEQKRNSLIENQRISRGQSKNISFLNPDEFDALVLPGGNGVLTCLTSWNQDHINFKVHPQLEKIILRFHEKSKPLGAICIAPLIVAQVLKKYSPTITLGEQSDLIASLSKINTQHESCPSSDFITDRDCKLISTPAYMNEQASPYEVFTGIRLMIKELVEMA